MKVKYCIVFSGAIGSSKSPIAHHVGWNLGLPVFNNDTLRTEVKEDLLDFDSEEYEKRRDDRLFSLLDSGKSFIYDASIDRNWQSLKEKLEENDYEYFIINLDLSETLLRKLYEAKGYVDSEKNLDSNQADHQAFVEKHKHLVNLRIDDEMFSQRLELSLKAVSSWVESK